MANPSDLQHLRAAVDRHNAALRAVVLARLETVAAIGRLKAEKGLPAVDAKREAAMRRSVLKGLRGRDREVVGAVFDAAVAACRATVVALTRRRRAAPRGASRPRRSASTPR